MWSKNKLYIYIYIASLGNLFGQVRASSCQSCTGYTHCPTPVACKHIPGCALGKDMTQLCKASVQCVPTYCTHIPKTRTVWVSAFVGVWMCGCVGAWVCGCVGAWVRGCVGACAWVRGGVGVCVCVGGVGVVWGWCGGVVSGWCGGVVSGWWGVVWSGFCVGGGGLPPRLSLCSLQLQTRSKGAWLIIEGAL